MFTKLVTTRRSTFFDVERFAIFVACVVINFRYLFYGDRGTFPALKRANMDGSSGIVIVKIQIVLPQTIAADIFGRRIYFIDAYYGIFVEINFKSLLVL